MAKQVGIYQYSGKLNDAVGFTGRGGRNFIRVKKDKVKNPRSAGQSIQRMILATVGVAISYFSEVLNNAVEGKSNGSETLSYLRKTWLNMLRTANAGQADSTYGYLPKGKKQFIPNRYMMSQGRLIAPLFTIDDGVITLNADVTGTITEITASQAFPVVEVGNQITILTASMDDWDGQSFGAYCRFACKDDTTPVFVESNGKYVLNPAALDLNKAAGPWQNLEFAISGGHLTIDVKNLQSEFSLGAAIIVSNVENKQRSTSYFIKDAEIACPDAETNGAAVYPTYQNGGTTIDVASEVYLNNSARRVSENVVRVAANLPLALIDGTASDIQLPTVSELPTSLYITAHRSGYPDETLESIDIMQASLNATLMTSDDESEIKLTRIPAISANAVSFGVTSDGNNFVVLSGHGVLADGTPFTF